MSSWENNNADMVRILDLGSDAQFLKVIGLQSGYKVPVHHIRTAELQNVMTDQGCEKVSKFIFYLVNS